jgi:hypothetical protein
MQNFPPFGRELAEAQERLEEVLARCAIRLRPFGGVPGANDNVVFPGASAPTCEEHSGHGESALGQAG